MQFERRLATVDGNLFETLDALLDGSFAICSIITDTADRPVDYRFLRVSSDFEEATGLRNVEGRTIREIAPDIELKWIERFGCVATDRVPAKFEEDSIVTGARYAVRAAPVEPEGCFVMHFKDITGLHRAEAEREAALKHAQHLLKELGHRVMNSFASISAILAMEARAASPEGRTALERVQGRVQALAALYRRLDGAPQVDRVDIGDYLAGNVRSFRDSLAAPMGMEITSDLAPLMLPTQAAVPLALVLNELLTGAVKHAEPEGRSGRVHVSLSDSDGLCRLCVEGGGIDAMTSGSDTGRSLVTAFVGELGGEITFESGPLGHAFAVTFRTQKGLI